MATSLGHDGVRGTAASPMTTAAPAPRAWRPPPSHAQILRAAGWLSPAGGADTLQYESLARSHDVVRVVRRDGARVVIKRLAEPAWREGRSLSGELFVYRMAAWLQPLAAILPPPVFIDEARHILVLNDVGDDVGKGLRDCGFSGVGRALGVLHAHTANLSIAGSLAPGVLFVPDHLETAAQGRSASTKVFLAVLASDEEFASLLREGASRYEPCGVIHGDVRQDNWRLVTDEGGRRAVLVDWEFAGAGDPAWDVGSACADLIVERVRATADAMPSATGWPGSAEVALENLLRAYVAEHPAIATRTEPWDRVTIYAIARLLHIGSEWADSTGDASGPLVTELLNAARALLRARTRATTTLARAVA